MQTKFTRTVNPNTALDLVQEIISSAAAFVAADEEARQICSCHGPCSCRARYANSSVTYDGFLVSPDYHSGDNEVTFPAPDVCQVIGRAGSGDHTLKIDVHTGRLTVTHDGARRSFPGTALGLIPSWWGEINGIQDWTLVGYETTQPYWAAVAGWLNGQYGDGPSNLEEAIHEADQALAKEAVKKFRAAGRSLPGRVHADSVNNLVYTYDGAGNTVELDTRWTGVEYRRASANGVRL